MTEMKRIPRAGFPEEVGVSSQTVLDFLSEMDAKGVEFHSFMVIRHGKVACECYRKPYSADRPHAMYSVSKSFTATAVGFAVSEGLISLDTRLVDIFTEYAGKGDKYLSLITVGQLLTMTAGKNPLVIADKSKVDWVKSYMTSPYYDEPGKSFRYISENTFMLSAIINRVTGMCMRDYLQPRLFEPLGIDYPYWETDKNGVEAGGWGLYLKTEDLAKFMLCYHQGGVFEGRQVIPEEWAHTAVKAHADTSESNNPNRDSLVGYCYGFWRNQAYENSWRADGMFSQFGIAFEDLDAIFVCTSGIASEQGARDYIWEYFPRAFDDSLTAADTVPDLKEKLDSKPVYVPAASRGATRQAMIDKKLIRVRKKILLNLIGFPPSVIPLHVLAYCTDHAGNIDNIVFDFGEGECEMYWSEGDESNSALLGMDGRYRYGTIRIGGNDYRICANAEWTDDDTFNVYIRPIETIASRKLRFVFKGSKKVTIYPSSTPSIESIALDFVNGTKMLIKSELVNELVQSLLPLVPKVAEPKLKGRIK